MKNELSILIPVYNESCTDIVSRLLSLCQQRSTYHPNFQFEIIAADDASPRRESIEANREIARMPNCRFIERKVNIGAAAMRNLLADESRFHWLLYLDCDMQITSERFIDNYLECEHKGLINGGIAIGTHQTKGTNLRYLYEKRAEEKHSAINRARQPYKEFRSTNFMVERTVMQQCRFDERFKKSGYEDVMFGKELHAHHIPIHHIDNPTVMTDFEDNPVYMDKIDRSLQTLYTFRRELRGYSHLISLENGIHLNIVKSCIRLWHSLFGPCERKMLCGPHPHLRIFDLYRLGYYLTLTKND